MVERTEEEKVYGAPIKVILGGEEHEVRILTARESRPWRAKAGPFRAELIRYASVSSDDPVAFQQAFEQLMGNRIDETINLFFEYAQGLDKEKIEDVATDQELMAAFGKVVEVAFPFGQ